MGGNNGQILQNLIEKFVLQNSKLGLCYIRPCPNCAQLRARDGCRKVRKILRKAIIGHKEGENTSFLVSIRHDKDVGRLVDVWQVGCAVAYGNIDPCGLMFDM